MANAKLDQNSRPTLTALSSANDGTIVDLWADPVTHRLLVDNAGGGGGTVLSVSVVTANGFAGSVADPTTTPAITIETTVTGLLLGNGTAVSAAPTTGSGDVVLQTSPTLITPNIGAATGTSLSVTGILRSSTSLVLEETGAGTDTITIQAPSSIAAPYTLTLPVDDGDNGDLLATDGNGVLSWTTPSGFNLTVEEQGGTSVSNVDTIVFDGATVTDDTGGQVTVTISGGTIGGTIADTQVAFGTGADTIGGDADLTWDNTGKVLDVAGDISLGTNDRVLPGGSSASQLYWDGTNVVLSTVSLAAPVRIEGNAIQLRTGGSVYAVLDTSNLATTNKTVTFPNHSLTLDNITTSTTTNGTGFLKGNGSVISFDNSTYLTGLTVGSTTIASGATTRILYDNAGVLGEYTITGTGTVVAMQTSPSLLTSLLMDSGFVMNWASSNVVLTHSSGILTLGTGELRITTPGTNSASVPTLGSTSTLTNKRITARITSISSSATPTVNTDNCDCVTITALAATITSMTTNLSGTPNNFDKLIYRIKDDGTPRGITWGASFAAMGVALPTTTVASKVLTVGFIWDSVAGVWGCVASAQEA